MDLEFGVLGIVGKLVKYVVHSSKRKTSRKKPLLTRCVDNK
jgi:hypothetical protein